MTNQTQQLDFSPIPKPRMTQRDKWARRPCVLRYFAFKDKVRAAEARIADSGSVITFVVPMPKSWSKKKRAAMDGTPHQQKPDIDNLTKALLDAIFDDDSRVYQISTSKVWGVHGQIVIDHQELSKTQPTQDQPE